MRAADTQKSTRSVRHLLIKGARRDIKDRYGRTPKEMVEQSEYKHEGLRNELIEYLVSIEMTKSI